MKNTSLLLCAALALLSGCESMKVASERDPAYDFASIETYRWIPPADSILANENTFMDEELQHALERQLATQGWRAASEPDAADVLATYYVKIDTHTEYAGPPREDQGVSGGVVFNNATKQWSYKEGDSGLQEYLVETGVLHLFVQDAQTGREIWKGTLSTRLDRSQPIEKQRELYAEAARKLLEKLP